MNRDTTEVLHEKVAAVCPIAGVAIGNPDDKATWRVDALPAATIQQRRDAQSVVDGFDHNGPASTARITYDAAIAAGVALTWTISTTLNGTYAINERAMSAISVEQVSILQDGSFASGNATRAWPDMSKLQHTFNVAQFKIFAGIINRYMNAIGTAFATAQTDQPGNWPSNNITVTG